MIAIFSFPKNWKYRHGQRIEGRLHDCHIFVPTYADFLDRLFGENPSKYIWGRIFLPNFNHQQQPSTNSSKLNGHDNEMLEMLAKTTRTTEEDDSIWSLTFPSWCSMNSLGFNCFPFQRQRNRCLLSWCVEIEKWIVPDFDCCISCEVLVHRCPLGYQI